MATLEVLDGPLKGRLFRLDQDELIVGRLPYCDIQISERSVSRTHAHIVRSRGKYYVEDMNSMNGTFLNGRRVLDRMLLRDNDAIRIHNVPFLFRADLPAVEPARPATAPEQPTASSAPGELPATAEHGPDRPGVGLNVYEKLQIILEINRNLGSTLKVQEMLPKILDALFSVFQQSDRAYILLPDPDTGQLVVRAERQKEEGTMFHGALGPISNKVAERVMLRGEAVLSADGLDEREYEISESVLDFPTRSMMCAPLIGPLHEPQGIIYVDTSNPLERFHQDDLEVLVSVAATAGQALEYAKAHEARVRWVQRERELALAKQVQLHFLPQAQPRLPEYEFFKYYNAAEEVGGDYYGFVPLADGRLAVAVGDVSGKGMWAALIMANLCSEVRYHLATTANPVAAFEQLNREFSKPENEGWFVTFLLCVLDSHKHEITLLNAGHMPPLCRRQATGRVEEVGQDFAGPPLGCDAEIRYAPCTAQLAPGDSLVLFTDGISEAMNAGAELYGLQRLRQAIARVPPSLNHLCQSVLQDVTAFTQGHPQSDDVCLIGLQRLEAPRT